MFNFKIFSFMDIRDQMLQKARSVVCLVFPDKGGVSLLGAALNKVGSHVRYSITTLDELACFLTAEKQSDNDIILCDLLFKSVDDSLKRGQSPIIIVNERDFKYFVRLCRLKKMKACLKENSCSVVIGICDSFSGSKVSDPQKINLDACKLGKTANVTITTHPGPRFIDEVAHLYRMVSAMSSYERYLYYVHVMDEDEDLTTTLSVYFTSDFSRFLMPNRKLHSN